MKTALVLLLSTFFLFSEENLVPADDGWVLKKDKNNIKVFTRQTAEGKMKEFRIIALLKASMTQLVATLEDVEAYPQWMSDVKSTKILRQFNPNEKYYYIEIDAPWPISNRDNIIHFQLQADTIGQVVTIKVEGMPDYIPEKKDIVRIPHSGGTWELRPKENGETEVISLYATDPGGNLPDWVINMFIVDRCYRSLINLKEFVEKKNARE
ncbi:MAG: START domain-containing protein [Bacteroidales bacterium]|nr:START domain-containing protein [Bacteroidales bacterium]